MLTAVRLPLPWDEFDLPNPLMTRSTVLTTGDPAWAWEGGATETHRCSAFRNALPLLAPVSRVGPRPRRPAGARPRSAAVDLADIGLSARLRIDVRGRQTAFYRVGPLLEVIESPVRAPSLFGTALVTEEPLEVVALRWRSIGREVTDPRPAVQPGRRIITVKATEAGLAVMSPDRAVSEHPGGRDE